MADQKTDSWDYVIIGSGFGGSVSALRLAEKGYRVLVIEQGKRWRDKDFPANNRQISKSVWMPALRMFGLLKFSVFRHLFVVHGIGVGGGSLVYANTHLRPGSKFFKSHEWSHLADWEAELAPHYDRAESMLGVTNWKHMTRADEVISGIARDLGRERHFGLSKVAVFLGEPGQTVADPYFAGKGPPRTGCTHCGACMTGCKVGAKNTLVKNYLYLAEGLGANVLAETKVSRIDPDTQGGYRLRVSSSSSWVPRRHEIRAKHVVISAGCIGTIDLLLRCRDIYKSLPNLSDKLGHNVRTNSEAITGVTEVEQKQNVDHTKGVAITSHFQVDDETKIEPVRYGKGSDLIKFLVTVAGDGYNAPQRLVSALKTAFDLKSNVLKVLWRSRWAESTLLILVMQAKDNKLSFALKRRLFGITKTMQTKTEFLKAAPSYIPLANELTRMIAKRVNGVPLNGIPDLIFGASTTAHLIGGAAISGSRGDGVIDVDHQVFGYPGLYVIDGSAIPANLGVNPSLTITAMAERAMNKIPIKTIG